MGQKTNQRKRSSARIANERARRSRKTRRSSADERSNRRHESVPPKRAKRKAVRSKKSGRSTTKNRKTKAPSRHGEFYKTARLAIIVFAMAAIGFLVVVGMDTLGKNNGEKRQDYVSAQAKKAQERKRVEIATEGEPSALESFWNKLVDRFLDNDLPEIKAPKKTVKKKVKSSEKTVAKKAVPKNEKAPLLPETKSKRADVKTPRAQKYTKSTEPLKSAEKKRVADSKNQRARLDAILNSVGIDGIR